MITNKYYRVVYKAPIPSDRNNLRRTKPLETLEEVYREIRYMETAEYIEKTERIEI